MIYKISDYVDKGYISFHTPCHMGRNNKINKLLKSSFDLTELEETDNLFYEVSIIKDFEEKMAKSLGGDYFYPLVNGATSGVMASLGIFNENDKIIIDRNCHISVINAVKLYKLNPVFIETSFNDFGIPNPPDTEDIKNAFNNNPDAKGLFITNPNYYGMWAKMDEISAFLKSNNLILICDEAHGTHFRYLHNKNFKPDISILSFHKNLPSLTQTGGILINNKNLKDKVKENSRNFTSTSPSYLFMLSIDCMDEYMKLKGAKKLREYILYLDLVKKSIKRKNIRILSDNDPFKFVVNCKDAKYKAQLIKDKYKIVCEMCDDENITFIVSIHNYKKEIELLKKGIIKFCKDFDCKEYNFKLPKGKYLPYEVIKMDKEEVLTKEASGRVSAETVINFPPSVPVIVEGEIINDDVLKYINKKTIKCVIE